MRTGAVNVKTDKSAIKGPHRKLFSIDNLDIQYSSHLSVNELDNFNELVDLFHKNDLKYLFTNQLAATLGTGA